MIVKNESKTISRCLDSVKDLVDEIIIVDTGSRDSTKKVCAKYTPKVFDYTWHDDFSAARNFSFSKATSDYIMWLDADDVVPENSLKQLLELKRHLTADTYMLKYNIAFNNNTPTFSFYRERIIRNCEAAKWSGCVHECIAPFGKIERLDIPIEHHKIKTTTINRNIKIYNEIIKSRPLTTREQYYYGRELFDHNKYKKCIRILNNFIDSNSGWIENIIDACYIVSKCYKQLNNHNKQLQYLFKTFQYSTPRPNICCAIGDYFLSIQNYLLSEYWYLLSLSHIKKTTHMGFVEEIYNGYYQYLQLCIIHYKLGNIKKSEYYNNLADSQISTEITKNNKLFFTQKDKK
jgi:glycosyltransferase involved in cell wall biosynthesis